MTLSTKEITLLSCVPAMTGQKGRLYYFQGNFFHPLTPHGGSVSQIKRAIREFHKTHAKLIASDRASPDYLDLTQLANL